MPKSKSLKKSPNLKQVQKIFEKDAKLLEDFTNSISKNVEKGELSKHGGPLSKIAGAIGSYAGEYNPDDISIDTYNKLRMNAKKAVVWKKFKSLYPDTVNIKLDEMENFDGIVQKWVGNDIRIPVEKSFIFTHDKGDSFGNLFGVSRLKPAYDCWYWW